MSMSTGFTVKSPVRVVVVDDSALFRRLLTEMLEAEGTIEVVGAAPDPFVARKLIKELNPEVITLDVEMGGMDGITFLGHLMRLRPMPVVMVSSLTERGAEVTLDAMALGAVDVVLKPKMDISVAFKEQAHELRRKVIAASKARPARLDPNAVKKSPARSGSLGFRTTDQLIAIGSSTGGTEAVRTVLETMPGDAPCVVIAQHIPPSFSETFAMRLDSYSALKVKEAADGDPIISGHAYVAPGSHHLEVVRSGTRFQCKLSQTEAVNHHRPSVEVLFNSVAKTAGRNVTAVMLTGMGNDGAKAMVGLKELGAHTICQDEESSVVWGMPGSAVKLGAACEVLPLDRITNAILKATQHRESQKVSKVANG